MSVDYSKMSSAEIADHIEANEVIIDDDVQKSEEEIWCDYREIMYNAWVEKNKR